MKSAIHGVLMGVALAQGIAFGAELGRQPVNMGQAPTVVQAEPVAIVKNYSGMSQGGLGIEAGVDWVAPSWKVGPDSYSDNGWAPSVVAFYGIGKNFDLKADLRYFSMDAEPDAGKTDPALDVMRMGIGLRGWGELSGDAYGYAGLALAYYAFDGDAVDSAKGTLGGSIECGLAYLINEFSYVRMGLLYEQTLADAAGKTDSGSGDKLDVSMRAIGVGLGVGVRF